MDNNLKHSIVHAHDLFFKAAMGDIKVAQDLLTAYLPQELLQQTDLKTLEIVPGSYVSPALQHSESDILFKAMINGHEAFVYFLFDHKSKPEKFMPLHMIEYTCEIYNDLLKTTKPNKLPLIYPIVLYHGPQAYPYSNDLRDLIDAPRELIERYFLKPFHLIDLHKTPDAELKKHLWSGIMEMMLKHIWDADVLLVLEEIVTWMQQIYQSEGLTGKNYIYSVIIYSMSKGELKDREKLRQLVNQISTELGECTMSLAEQLLAEGEAKGEAKGRAEGKAEGITLGEARGETKKSEEIALNMLKEGVEIAFIAKITNLSMARIQELKNTLIQEKV